MDYKFKQSAVLVASLLVLLVLVFVLVSNKGAIKRKANAANKPAVSTETSVPEEKVATSETFFKGQQVGNNLSAWKSDPLLCRKRDGCQHWKTGPRIHHSASVSSDQKERSRP